MLQTVYLTIVYSGMLLVAIAGAAADNLSTVQIQIDVGNDSKSVVVGSIVTGASNNDRIFSFRGMPYAQSPVGELRFKDPKPIIQLPAEIDGRYAGHDCPSIYATNASEDCLLLNVYTKNVSRQALLPVLVFIPPGGFYVGSGLSTFLGPELLLTQALVLVTLNYRLGSMGFLNLGTRDVPGNAGLKDQVLALRWVQQYIQFFGGNPANVTLGGYSAGAVSVGLHLTSPMSRGLFQKAILMSGALPPQTVLPRGNQINLARRQVTVLNCTQASYATEILACLNRYDGVAIAATLRRMFDFGMDNPIYLWLPIIENDYGHERFLVEDFYESLRAGRFQKVPLLIGHVDGELGSSAAQIIQNSTLEREFYNNYSQLAPIIFMYKGHSNWSQIGAKLKEQYLATSAPQQTEIDRLTDLFSDAIIRFGEHRISELISRHSDVFSYKFQIRGEFSVLNYPLGNARVEHLDDLTYLFRMPINFFSEEHAYMDTARLYTSFMFDFIANGKLTSPMAKTFPQSYVHLWGQNHLTFQVGVNFDEADLWCSLFP